MSLARCDGCGRQIGRASGQLTLNAERPLDGGVRPEEERTVCSPKCANKIIAAFVVENMRLASLGSVGWAYADADAVEKVANEREPRGRRTG